jgi:Secretion system C-terminal sorting domain
LDKDHRYRHGMVTTIKKALVNDNFGTFSNEAFAASGYKAFAPMVGANNIESGAYFANVYNKPYLAAYACGGGWYTGASGVGTTDSFVKAPVYNVFAMLFGSYFGDWDVQNSFLRAPLAAAGNTLTNCWSGRPHWIMHQMALDEPIGYCTRISQSDTQMYFRHPDNRYGCLRNNALMGDPTIRMTYITPPKSINLAVKDDTLKKRTQVLINWHSNGIKSTMGYNVYRAKSLQTAFEKINSIPVIDSAFTDTLPHGGNTYYMVRAYDLATSSSGTYYTMSTGIFDSIAVRFSTINDIDYAQNIKLLLFPNPANNQLNIITSGINTHETTLEIFDITGRLALSTIINPQEKSTIDVSTLQAGMYILKTNNCIQRFVKE